MDRLIDLDPGNYRKDHLFKWPFALNPGPKIVSNSQIHNPDDDGYVTYHEIERIKPCRGEILREQPSEGSKSLGPVKGEYLQLISFSGDWVKVIEPLDISELPNIVEGESCPLLRIRWNQNRTGWIRWRIPGPIPGTFHVLLRGREYFGYYD